MHLNVFCAAVAALVLSGCVAQRTEAPRAFASHGGAAAGAAGRVAVCHGFGCALTTPVAFGARDIAAMRRLMGEAADAAAERAGIARLVAWAERRVAGKVGPGADVPGMDLWNAGRPRQMDCLDEAANTTSYLRVAAEAGLLRFHAVGRPASRGFLLDGRYPHATATVVAWAVDSWPTANGAEPVMMPLGEWYRRRSAGRG